MSNIDFGQLITPADRAAEAEAAHITAIKAECTARITVHLDVHTVANLQGAALVGALDPAQMSAFAEAQTWMRAMQTACRAAIATKAEPIWPDLPEGVASLAADF